TSAAAIAVSLIVSFTLTPMLAARWIKPQPKAITPEGIPNEGGAGSSGPGPDGIDERGAKPHTTSKGGRFYRPVDSVYMWMLRWSMAHRWVVVVICIIAVISIWPLYRYVGYN